MPFDFQFFLEVFGYIGTGLVILSMLMTSVVKLRILNICGSTISMIYAILGDAWPIVVLNGSLILINVIQLVRVHRTKAVFCRVKTTLGDGCAQYFLDQYEEDIRKYFPKTEIKAESEAYIAYHGSEMVGLIVGSVKDGRVYIEIDYSTPKYRDLSVSTFLFAKFREDGVEQLCADVSEGERQKYLERMGFTQEGECMVKDLR